MFNGFAEPFVCLFYLRSPVAAAQLQLFYLGYLQHLYIAKVPSLHIQYVITQRYNLSKTLTIVGIKHTDNKYTKTSFSNSSARRICKKIYTHIWICAHFYTFLPQNHMYEEKKHCWNYDNVTIPPFFPHNFNILNSVTPALSTAIIIPI